MIEIEIDHYAEMLKRKIEIGQSISASINLFSVAGNSVTISSIFFSVISFPSLLPNYIHSSYIDT